MVKNINLNTLLTPDLDHVAMILKLDKNSDDILLFDATIGTVSC